MKKQISALTLALGTVLLSGCYPDGPDYLSDYDLVYTNYSPTFDFKSVSTYSLPDSVPIITGDLADGDEPSFLPEAYRVVVLQKIRDNMNARGWEEVDGPNEAITADVNLLPAALKSEVVSYFYSGGYWGWYYPGYPGWGWYYPGYYPTYTSYTSGSLMIAMARPNDVSPTENVPVVWLAVINSILEGGQADIITRLNVNIDQAFTQSDYLTH